MLEVSNNANDLFEQSQTGKLDLDLIKDEAKKNLFFFAKGILGYDWLVPHIHLSPCLLLQNPEFRREVFVLPRGWLKTTLCTISYPIWCGVHDPEVRILVAQNTMTNSTAKLRSIRKQFEDNQILRALYPHVLPTRDSVWSGQSLELSRTGSYPEGTFDAGAVGTQVVSRHYNKIIEDDTVAPDIDELGEEMLAPSHADVQKAIQWHKLCLPLLTDPKTDEILVVGTRWYEYDLIRHIMEKESQYQIIARSCREDSEGNSDPHGEITYPERFDAGTLKELEESMGPYFFSTLYLNHPVSVGDMVFKPEWIQYYEELPPPHSLFVYTTMDAATDPQLSTGRPEEIDYSTVLTAAKDVMTGNIYVLEYFRARCSPGEHLEALFDQVKRWKPVKVGYEDVAYQRSIDYWVKETMRKRDVFFTLEPIKRQGRKSKEAHIMGLQPVFQNGAVFIRKHHKELQTELLSFPRGQHDDLIDTLAMQLNFWRKTKVKRDGRHKNLAYLHTLEGAIENIRRRKMGEKGTTLISNPLECAQFFRNN